VYLLLFTLLQCDTATTVAAAIVSTAQSPLAVVEVLKEGRCSLITAYVLVNYNIMYAIIQLFMTCYLNNLGLVFGDYMYLIQDMFYSLVLGLCIADTPPSDALCKQLPPQTLFSPWILAKLLPQLGIFPAFQAITLAILKSQRWYVPFETDDPLNESYANEGAALNIIALAQLMIASVVVTIGQPYRQAWYTNKTHIGVLLLQTAFIMYLLFGESNEFMVGIDNKPAPHKFQGILIGIIAANVFVSAVATKLADYLF
jgi:cation-transporting P-type ATPase 13A2